MNVNLKSASSCNSYAEIQMNLCILHGQGVCFDEQSTMVISVSYLKI